MTSTPNLSTIGTRAQAARRIAAACGVGVLLLGTGACGSNDQAPASQSSPDNGGASTNQQGQGQRPGADGEIAAVADNTAQVQSATSGQVAVSWTSSTTFTKQVAAKLADLKVGDCVMVSSESTAGTGDATQAPEQASAVTATSVRITEPVDGSCTPTGGPAGGGPPSGSTGDGPQLQGEGPGGQAPGGQPPAGAQFRGIGGAFGTVKSISATGFVVESTRPAVAGATAESTEVTVTVTAKTTYTTTAKGSASDVKVGQCLRAEGQTDNTGAVAATTIAITPPVEGECGGFMRRTSSGTGSGNDSQGS